MRQLVATARRSPASLVGPLVALTGAAIMVTMSIQIVGRAQTAHMPVHRLAGAPVVVTADAKVRFVSGHGDNKDTTAYALPRGVFRMRRRPGSRTCPACAQS